MTSVDAFLDELAHALRGTPGWRREVMAEIRGHLREAVEQAGGNETAVLARFGDPGSLARELNRSQRRRWLRPALAAAAVAGVAATAAVLILPHDGGVQDGSGAQVGRVVAVTPRSVEIARRRAEMQTVRVQRRLAQVEAERAVEAARPRAARKHLP